jgi:peptidoglycan/LPS O-acetylase OafA/YrhL
MNIVFASNSRSISGTAVDLIGPRVPHVDYRTDIDGLRAIAVLSVVAFHVSPGNFSGGYAGVDIFFVISGFLISGIILRDLAMEEFSCLEFYARRVRRIVPALVTVLFSVLGIGWLILLPDEYQMLGKNVLGGAGFLTNWNLYQDYEFYFGLGLNPLIHLWSLGIEEQFYLVWPLFLLLICKSTSARLAFILLITLVSFTLNVIAAHSDPSGCFYLPWNRLWELSSGAALAYLDVHAEARQNVLRTFTGRLWTSWLFLPVYVREAVGSLLLLLSIFGLNDRIVYPGWWALGPCVGTLLLISTGPHGWIARMLLSTRPVVFIGIISYPLYLWHWPLLAFGHVVLGADFTVLIRTGLVTVAFALAIVTYKYVELPIRTSQNRRQVVSQLCISMLACAGCGLLVFSETVPARLTSPEIHRLLAAAMEDWRPETYHLSGAHWVRWAHWTVAVDAPVIVGSAPRSVVFLGDSNMQQYFPRIAKVMADHPLNSHNAVFSAGSGCAPAVMEILRSRYPDALFERCRKTIRQGISYAKRPIVDAVVISAQWYAYLVEMTDGGKLSTDGVLYDLRQLVSDFISDGKRVFIVLNIPRGDDFDPRQMIRRTLQPPGFKIDIHSESREEIEKIVGPTGATLRRIAAQLGASVIDPVEFLCNERVCPAVTANGEPMYKDGSHLRASYVRDNVRFLDRTILDAEAKATSEASATLVRTSH